jgi:hypothetical protein
VILNRTWSGRWGGNIKDVVTHPWQFEPWMTRRGEMESFSPADPRYQNAALIADGTRGTDTGSYCGRNSLPESNSGSAAARGSLPSWAHGEGRPIGRHTFYSPSEGGAEPDRPVFSMSALGNPLSCGSTEDKPSNTHLETDRLFDHGHSLI